MKPQDNIGRVALQGTPAPAKAVKPVKAPPVQVKEVKPTRSNP